MFDKFFDHEDDFVAYLYKSFDRYDFKAFYLICDIVDCKQKFIWIDL